MAVDIKTTPSKNTVYFLYDGLKACWPRLISHEDEDLGRVHQESWGGYDREDFLRLAQNVVALALDKIVNNQEAADQIVEWRRRYEENQYPNETVPPELERMLEELDQANKTQPNTFKTLEKAKKTLLASEKQKEALEKRLKEEEPPSTSDDIETELPPGVEEETETRLTLRISPSTAAGLGTFLAKIILTPAKMLLRLGGGQVVRDDPELKKATTAVWLLINGITSNQILAAVRVAEAKGITIETANIQKLVDILKAAEKKGYVISHLAQLAYDPEIAFAEGMTQAELMRAISLGEKPPPGGRLKGERSPVKDAFFPPGADVPQRDAEGVPFSPEEIAAIRKGASPEEITAIRKGASPEEITAIRKGASPEEITAIRKGASPEKTPPSLRDIIQMLRIASSDSGEIALRADNTTESYYLPEEYFDIGKPIGKVGSLIKKPITKIASKVLKKVITRLAGKAVVSSVTAAATTATGAEVGAGLGALLGISGGPLAIVTAAIGAIVGWISEKIISKIAIWIKKNKKNALIVGAIPVIIVGAVTGAPVVIIGGIVLGGGLLVIRAGGVAAAVGGIFVASRVFAAAVTAFIVSSILAPLIIFFIAVPIIVVFVLYIINAGAYVVPPGTLVTSMYGVTGVEAQSESQYMKVEKVPDRPGPFDNSELPLKITYTITITAKEGVLTNIQFENTYAIVQDPLVAPIPNPPMPDPPDEISPASGPYILTYTYTYGENNEDFTNSIISDSFKVTADAPGRPWDTAIGTAIIKIGDPPEDCPSGWPIGPEGGESQLAIVQGPRGSYSHSLVEAIDVSATQGHTITARHSGIATVVYTTNVYRPAYVDIASTCNGIPFTSRYAHLSTVGINNNQTVTLGQAIGTSGTDGTGPHLHYEFRGLPMAPPNIPKSVPYGCGSGCGTIP